MMVSEMRDRGLAVVDLREGESWQWLAWRGEVGGGGEELILQG
jgi:hypothetical protein